MASSSSSSTPTQQQHDQLGDAPDEIVPPSASSSHICIFLSAFITKFFNLLQPLYPIWLQFLMASTSSSSTPTQQHNHLEDAFDEIVPESTSTSASFSSSASSSNLPWDVFINHCGTDVKHTLATNIRDTLARTGLRVFLDVDALRAGDVIPTNIQHAMSNASLHIAIFSINYALSPWCLAELSFMLKSRTKIIPLFYHVDPSDLRRVAQGNGIYAPAFSKYEEKKRYTSEKIKEWKTALESVSLHSGFVVDNNRDEGRVLKTIVNMVNKVMDKVPFQVAKYPVGMPELVQDFESRTLGSAEGEENAKIVGIVGMGGAGKTTLAKELFNQKSSSFQNCSFIFEVRDAVSRNALQKKQKKLLKDLGAQDKDLTFDNTEEGKGILESRLRSLSALIVLDDVDREEQLDALLPQIDRLGSGSLIIVTSRDLGVFKKWRNLSIYNMRSLNPFDAKQLFCWHAFLQSHPLEGFESLVEKFVNACSGLPLSLKVFGGQVYGNLSKVYWESLLHKISLPGDIKDRLQISYDALDKDEQEAFMDVACFFIGERLSLAIAVWDGCEGSGLHSWETLVNKCLVDLDQNNCVTMHDHLRDLGRDLANSHSLRRLWHQEHIINIKKQAQERIPIRGMKIDFYAEQSLFMEHMGILNRWFRRPLPSLLGLKLLIDRGYEFTNQFATPSEDLVWFRGLDFQKRELPSWLSLGKLRLLELQAASNLKKLWANADPPLQLRELTITFGPKFQSFPTSIGLLKHLKMIIVTRTHMKSLPQEFCNLELLEHLDLSHSSELSSLPVRFGELTSLRHIGFSACRRLEMLPVSFKQLIHMQHLALNGCSNLNFRLDMMENMTKLEYLNFGQCRKLQQLPHQITNQASLRELDVKETSLRVLPTNIGQLGKLKMLKIGSPLIENLPSSIENLSSLTRLTIGNCTKLKCLPDAVGRLNMLEELRIYSSGVKSLPKDFGQLSHLRFLQIKDCPLTELGSTPPLCKEMRIEYTQVSKISISEDCCPSLETLSLYANQHLTDIETLPTSVKFIDVRKCNMLKKMRGISRLANLQTLTICDCPELDELPSFADLSSIKEIRIEGCDKIEKIEGLEHSRSLETLRAETSWKSQGIQSLEQAERLKSVSLVAESRSALQPCIQSIKKWPCEIIIGGRAVSGVESVMESLAFPNLTVVRSFKKKSRMALEFPKRYNSDAAFVCFVVNAVRPFRYANYLLIEVVNARHSHETYPFIHDIREWKWVIVGVLRQGSRFMDRDSVAMKAWVYTGMLERGMLVVGEEGRVLEAFTNVWHLFSAIG